MIRVGQDWHCVQPIAVLGLEFSCLVHDICGWLMETPPLGRLYANASAILRSASFQRSNTFDVIMVFNQLWPVDLFEDEQALGQQFFDGSSSCFVLLLFPSPSEAALRAGVYGWI